METEDQTKPITKENVDDIVKRALFKFNSISFGFENFNEQMNDKQFEKKDYSNADEEKIRNAFNKIPNIFQEGF